MQRNINKEIGDANTDQKKKKTTGTSTVQSQEGVVSKLICS